MKVLVTGANGFVGRHIVEFLSVRGHDVRAAARRRLAATEAPVAWVAAPDLGPDANWTAAVAGVEVVVHCAARVHVMNETASDPLYEFRRANCEGTMTLARAAAAAGVKRFVFLSSIKVNGESTPVDRPFRADDEPRPLDPYGVSKLEAEQELLALSRATELEVVIIRPVLVYGPGVGANFRRMMRAVASGVPLPLKAIHNRRSMVFVGNLASLVHCVAEHPSAPGHVFLVSDGADYSTSDMLRMLAKAMGRSAKLLPMPAYAMSFAAMLIGKGAVARRLFSSLAVDINATRDILGWEPPIPVEEGLAETVRAFQAEPQSAK